MKLNFISVTANDLERASEFYSRFLQGDPDEETKRLVSFEFEGIEFGIHYPEADGISLENFEFGNNAVPASR